MQEFACEAVVPGCDAKVSAETEDELLQKVAEHARDVHGMDEVPPDVLEQVRSNITQV